MKKALLFLAIFIIFSITSFSCPMVDAWDKGLILFIQDKLKDYPVWIPLLPDCKLYTLMIVLPLFVGTIVFAKEKKYLKILFIYSIPLVSFLFNCIIKPLFHRLRPPLEMQLAVHPDSFSYVSSHSLVTICLWGMVIYFIFSSNIKKIFKIFLIFFSILWILFVGFSRIWLGVHHPSDVIGAYLLGLTLLSFYLFIFKKRFEL